MNKEGYYILGPYFNGNPMYWNKKDQGWVIEFEDATPYTKDILTKPLPREASCIMQFSSNNEPIAQFDILPPTRGLQRIKNLVINFFLKSY